MAKQVSEILIKLGLEGVQGLDKLKGAFRELEKSIGPNNAAIERARQSVIDYGRDSRNTEQVIKGQIDALRGLQSQVERGSSTWAQLATDIEQFRQASRRTDGEIEALRQSVLRSAATHNQSRDSIQSHIRSLQALSEQASLTGTTLGSLRRDIANLEQQIEVAEQGSRRFRTALGQVLAVNPQSVLNQWRAYRQVLQDASSSAEELALAEQRLRSLSGAPRIEQRRAISAQAEIVGSAEYQRRFGIGGTALVEQLPDVSATLSQQLRELGEDLQYTARSTETYLQVAVRMAELQRELTATTQGLGVALVAQLRSGELAPTARNLQEAASQLRREMAELDTTTAEGARAYAVNAREANSLERRLRDLANAYRTVDDAARSASPAREGVNPYTASGARNATYALPRLAELETALRDAEQGNINAIDSLLSAKRTMYEYEAQQLALLDGEKDRLAARDIERQREETAQADIAFKRELQRLDLLAQQRKAAASAMGLGGREDLSPLYRDITNLATASVRREQSMMGRSATQVLTDMFTAFDKGGRGVDIKQRSTQIGESIAQGITAGALDKQTLNTGADKLSSDFITALKRAFRIKSPSAESRDQIGVPIGQGIGKGIVKGLKDVQGEVVGAVRVLLSGLTATPQRAALPAQQTALSDKLQSFLARSSAKTSTFLPFARLMGEEAVSSQALTLATYRKAYERGGIVPSMYMPIGQRRNVRGVPGIPGYGLEQEIRAAAVRNVGRTGAFVGPISGPRTAGFASVTPSSLGITTGSRLGGTAFAGQLASLFAASSPLPARGPLRYGMAGRDAFPVEGMLGGGRALTLGRAGALGSTKEAIASYRKAVANFWEGESGTFETIRRIVSSGVQLSASRLAKRLTDTVELPTLSGIKSRIGAAVKPAANSLYGLLTGDTDRSFNVWKGAAGYSNLGGFPISGMQQIGGVRAGGGSFIPMLGGTGGGGGGRPTPPVAAAAPPPPPPAAAVVPPKVLSDYDRLTEAVSRFGSVSKRSTADLREFSGSLRGLQEILNPTAADFQKVNQIIEKQGNILDREIEKRQTRNRNRITAGQAAQAAGAAISGGIFGGPEGFLGGVGGAALGSAIPGLGTVGGAFAGAAIGAQVSMFRQQTAGTADYAAQIGKLQVALRGIVGSQADYETALRVAASVTRELNIPQEVAIGGLTRLTAAVRGAGGTITDSSFAFTAVNEAIKATGGGAQQAEGAILALTQVFSKGKVSAEELNQLAERLPGTFTLFAQAAGKTGPELQKALEQGQVGLNDLTKFLAILRDKYSGTAKTIAQSSEEAGARLQVAFNGMRLSVGKALQPLGAEFQNAFANFIYTITPALTAAVTGVANAISGMYKMIASGFGLLSQLKDLVINVTKVLIVFGGVSAGVFVANNITTFTTAIKGTLVVLRTMLSIEKALLVIESARLATQTLIAGLSAGATKGRVVGAVLGGAAGIGAVLGIGEVIKKIVNDVEAGLSGGLGNIKLDVKDLTTFSAPPDKGADKATKAADKATKAAEKAAAKERKNLFNELLDQLNARNKVLTQQGRLNEKVAQTESEKAALALLTAEELLDNEKAQLDLRLKYGEVSKQVYTQQQEAIRLEGKVVREEFNKTVKSIKDEADSLVSGITGPGGLAGPTENPLQRASRELTDEIKKRQERAKQLGGPRGDKAFKDLGAIDVNKVASFSVVGQDIVDLTNQISELERGGEVLTVLEQLAQKYVQIWDDLDPKLQQQLITLTAQKDALTKQKEAAQELKALYADIGMSIKEGVVGAIQGAIDGTKSLQQVATDLLSSIANRLLDVAVNMALFGAMSGTGTGGGLLGSFFKPNAKGNAYAQNGIVPFAMGGIVNKPTLFKFANGGAGNLGLMGEAGPEAIIPLKRGRDGKLGVVASGSDVGGGGGVVSVGEINITVQNTGETLSPGAQKQIAGQVQGIVLATLANERRSGGMLR